MDLQTFFPLRVKKRAATTTVLLLRLLETRLIFFYSSLQEIDKHATSYA